MSGLCTHDTGNAMSCRSPHPISEEIHRFLHDIRTPLSNAFNEAEILTLSHGTDETELLKKALNMVHKEIKAFEAKIIEARFA